MADEDAPQIRLLLEPEVARQLGSTEVGFEHENPQPGVGHGHGDVAERRRAPLGTHGAGDPDNLAAVSDQQQRITRMPDGF
jgi:hypothetical protein